MSALSSDRDRLLRERLQARLDRAARTTGIPRRATDGPAPLSPMQESIWLLQQMEPEGAVYHRPVTLRLSGTLDLSALRQALGDLVERHESLRSVFFLHDGQPSQQVRPPSSLPLDVVDLRASDDPEADARARAADASREPIDLEHGPTVRARLFRVSADRHLLLLHLHHLAFDGWSEGALRSDLARAYAARVRGEAPAFEPLAAQMADIAAWQQARRASGGHGADLAYWRRQLAGLPTTLDLPTDRPRAGTASGSATLAFDLPADLTDRLRALARSEGATLYMVLLAGLEVLLARYARQTDFAVGTPVAGRTHAEMEGTVGCLINLLVLRAQVDGDEPFRSLLRRVRRTVVEALDHQGAPLADVVAAAFPDRRGFDPVYQVLFQLRNLPAIEADETLGFHPVKVPTGSLASDLALDVVDGGAGQGLSCRLAYRTDLFEAATIERMADHLRVLLDAAASGPERTAGTLPLLTANARRLVVDGFQVPMLPPLDVGGIQVLVEQQAALRPEAVAVVSGDEVWTYGEVNARANRLAHRLQALGVGPGVVVALGCDPSPDLVMAVIAVLKAGGAYVPLDPEHPEARIQAILDSVGAPLLLTCGPSPWPALGVRTLDLDTLDRLGEPDTNPPTDGLPPDRPAYVLYTSGSTGEPKGVVVTQANLLAGVPGWEEVYRLSEREAFVQTARPTFDVFTESWIRTLGFGLRLVLCSRDTLLDPPAFVRLIRENGVDSLSGVPAVFRLLMTYLEESRQRLDGVRLVVVGADVWRPEDHARARTLFPNASVQNTYGITETTVSNTAFEGDPPALPSGSVPIGRGYPNSLLYVLDPYGEPVPVGVPGELYVGGPVVGAGYVGRPDLTAERFVPDPFVGTPEARMYRSGDLVRWLPTGDLDFLGRIDFQVKIRGLRIELGEIEAVLAAHPTVTEAVVAVQGGADDAELVAYVVPASGEWADADALRAHARSLLPAYMVPATVAVLDRLPLSANGKVDRRALTPVLTGTDSAPREGVLNTSDEAALAAIWGEVLGRDGIGRHDDFFDLGGHSLRAMQVISRVQQHWGVSLAFRDIAEAPVLSALTQRILHLRSSEDVKDETPPVGERAPRPRTGEPGEIRPGEAPRAPIETELAEVWTDVLGRLAIRREDDFFDLGGHSLRAIQVLSRVQRRWGVALAFRDMIEAPTLAGFAERIRQHTEAAEEVENILGDLGGLSDDELQALLGNA